MISGPYTLFTRVPVFLDEDGGVWADPLWKKDLELHLPYIPEFRLCCTVQPRADAPEGVEKVEGLSARDVIGLRKDLGRLTVLRNLIPNFLTVLRAVRRTRTVHSGGAGWAFPLSFYILLLRPFLRFDWVMVIESTFWMKPASGPVTLRQNLRHGVHKGMLGAALRRADARIFTSRGYRDLFGIDDSRSLVAPAVWVDAASVMSEDALSKRLAGLPSGEVRLIFPARLIPDKGSDVILQAIARAEDRLRAAPIPAKLTIDLIGAGPDAQACRDFATAHQGQITVRFLEPVQYGAPFFALLGDYNALLLANRQHEQPRVIFDGFSQGLPVISSDTLGVRDIVAEGKDALLFDIDDADGLATQMIAFSSDPDMRQRMSQAARASVIGRSHAEMHSTRQAFLEDTLGGQA